MSITLRRAGSRVGTVTTSDTVDLPGGAPTVGLYVGGAGTIVCDINGVTVTFVGVPVGTVLPIAPTRIRATGTTATNMVALYLQ